MSRAISCLILNISKLFLSYWRDSIITAPYLYYIETVIFETEFRAVLNACHSHHSITSINNDDSDDNKKSISVNLSSSCKHYSIRENNFK